MSEPTPTILEDERPIAGIWYADENNGGWDATPGNIGTAQCDRIEAYPESGQCASVPFFAVYLQGEIVARVPAHLVTVHYAQPREHPKADAIPAFTCDHCQDGDFVPDDAVGKFKDECPKCGTSCIPF